MLNKDALSALSSIESNASEKGLVMQAQEKQARIRQSLRQLQRPSVLLPLRSQRLSQSRKLLIPRPPMVFLNRRTTWSLRVTRMHMSESPLASSILKPEARQAWGLIDVSLIIGACCFSHSSCSLDFSFFPHPFLTSFFPFLHFQQKEEKRRTSCWFGGFLWCIMQSIVALRRDVSATRRAKSRDI